MTENDLLKLAALHFYLTAKTNNITTAEPLLLKSCLKESKKILEKFDKYLNEISQTTETNNENN